MNFVKKLNKHTIYYYCDNKIKYYINVPHKEFNITNISLEFLEDTSKYDLELNDVEWVKSNIIEYYEKVDNDNITLIMPLLKYNERNMLLDLNINNYNLIEKLMALYINSGYLTLTKNNINVNKEVFLIENDKFVNFIKYFKEKHFSRIIVKRLIEINNDDDKLINIRDNLNEIKPFSINESFLNEVFKINDSNNNIVEVDVLQTNSNKIDNELPIELEKNNIKKVIVEEQNSINEVKLKKDDENITINKETDDKLPLINNNISDKDDKILSTDLNEKKSKEIKVTNIINAKDEKKEIEKKKEPVNNVINISDLGSLTAGGLNGALPGNVTINIEKLVTENNDNNKTIVKKDDDSDDEISGLDEDISDIDEFDENDDFDIDAIDVSEAVLSSDDGNKTYRTVTSGGIKFVVGRKDDDNLKPIEINKSNSVDLNNTNSNNQNLKIDMPTNIVKGDDQINKNAGFASYFTLFFVAISAVFIVLYIIIK